MSEGIGIQFATCSRPSALSYVRAVYPSRPVVDHGAVKEMLDLVEKDVIRIQDPRMYGASIQIVPGTHWVEADRDAVRKVCSAAHEEIMAMAPNQTVEEVKP